MFCSLDICADLFQTLPPSSLLWLVLWRSEFSLWLWLWHLIWIPVKVPAVPLLIHSLLICLGSSRWWSKCLDPYIPMANREEAPSSWLPPGPARVIVGISGVNQWMQDISFFSLSLLSLLSLSVCVSLSFVLFNSIFQINKIKLKKIDVLDPQRI